MRRTLCSFYISINLYILPFPYAIIYPWAMMIKPINAFIANIAMPTSWCPDYFTVGAEAIRFKIFK